MIIDVYKHDNVYIRIESDSESIIRELSTHFSFEILNSRFMRKKHWNGKIYLFNRKNKLLYFGLLGELKKFCKENGYEIRMHFNSSDVEFSVHEAKKYIDKLNLPFEARDYQIDAFVKCVRKRRLLIVSPTSSGKSLMIYLLAKLYSNDNKKVLIIVPTLSLIHQLEGDFKEYGYKKEVKKIFSGEEKIASENIVISTWQSVYGMNQEWFSNFYCIIGDEAHSFKAKSLIELMKKTDTIKYKFGFTGTMNDENINQMTLRGLFGDFYQTTTTKQLMQNKHIADLIIKILVLKYSKNDSVEVLKFKSDYMKEIEYITSFEKRTKFIRNLALSLEGNTLILFRLVDKHGKHIYDSLANQEKRKVYFIHGKVDGKERNDIRNIVEKENDSIIIASQGTFSEGISIKRIHNIIFANPGKSKIKVLQSIGRGLRLGKDKEEVTLFDIADDFSIEGKYNITLKHLFERVKLYDKEKFNYKIYNIKVGKRNE